MLLQFQIQKAHIEALVTGGRVKAAQAQAAAYGLSFDATLDNFAYWFLRNETEYTPGLLDDTMQRYNAAVAAIESPAMKTKLQSDLQSWLVENKHYDHLNPLLNQVSDPQLRSQVILNLMEYHSKLQGDAKTAADLYFAENHDGGASRASCDYHHYWDCTRP